MKAYTSVGELTRRPHSQINIESKEKVCVNPMELLGVTCCLNDASTNACVDLVKDKKATPLPDTLESSEGPSTQEDADDKDMNSETCEEIEDAAEINDCKCDDEEEKSTAAASLKPESPLQNEATAPVEQSHNTLFKEFSFSSSFVNYMVDSFQTKPVRGVAEVVDDPAVGEEAIGGDDDEVVSADVAVDKADAISDVADQRRANDHDLSSVDHDVEAKESLKKTIETKRGDDEDPEVDSMSGHNLKVPLDGTGDAANVFEDTMIWLKKLLKNPKEDDALNLPNDAVNAGVVNDAHLRTSNGQASDSSLVTKLPQVNASTTGGEHSEGYGGGVSEADSTSVKVESSVSSKMSFKEREKTTSNPQSKKSKPPNPFKSFKKFVDSFIVGAPKKGRK